jgi:hypothetical protein
VRARRSRKAPHKVVEAWGDGGPIEEPPAPWEWMALLAFVAVSWGALIWYAGVVVGWWAS